MKKIPALILALLMAVTLFGCNAGKEKISVKEFEKLLQKQPVIITDTELLVQTGNKADKRFYPDMLTSTVQNRTDKVITYLKIAFVGWDENGNPAKIVDADSGKSYETLSAEYGGINLESGRYYGKNMGIRLSAEHRISKLKAIVVAFKTKDGDDWQNPYYNDFKNAFVMKKLSDGMTLYVKEKKEKKFEVLTFDELSKTVLDEKSLIKKAEKFGVEVLSAEYVITGENKDTTPDKIIATFKNKTEKKIKSVVLTFFAWDENGKAVKIRDAGDNISFGNFTAQVEYTTPDFVKDSVFGNDNAYQVNENCGIKYVKAVVESYTTDDGTLYENPYLVDYCLIYEGKDIEIKNENANSSENTLN